VTARRVRSVAGQVVLVFTLSVIGVVIGAIIASIGLLRVLDARTDLNTRVNPAAVDTQRLLAALSDQETGLRGYVLSSSDVFLEPYSTGLSVTEEIDNRLTTELRRFPVAEQAHAAAGAAVDAWRQQYAMPTIAAVQAGDPGPRSETALATGKTLFDSVRTAISDLSSEILAEQVRAAHQLDRATYQLVIVLAAFGLMLVVGGLGIWRFVRVKIHRPLAALVADARAVSSGQLDHAVTPSGPLEFDRLGRDVEAMRRRIVDELRAVNDAHAELEAQARELARSNSELEQFAYVASHDLQEPLRKVTAFCQLLQSRYGGQLDEKADQYIAFAVDGAKRMQALINELLAFSRVGRRTGPLVDVDCEVALATALDNLAERIAETGATVQAGVLPTVVGEFPLVVAVLQNLVGNAIKFRRPGVAPVVRVDAEPRDDEWLFTVTDNGIGIEPQYADRVFQIFQRLHSKEAYEGTGIGLALCRKIVEDLGGKIWADTEPTASGATIRFTIPSAIGETV
jgi:signal transduction histidine kinase